MARTKVRSRTAAKVALRDAIRLLKDAHIYCINAGHYRLNRSLEHRIKYAAARVDLAVRTMPW